MLYAYFACCPVLSIYFISSASSLLWSGYSFPLGRSLLLSALSFHIFPFLFSFSLELLILFFFLSFPFFIVSRFIAFFKSVLGNDFDKSTKDHRLKVDTNVVLYVEHDGRSKIVGRSENFRRGRDWSRLVSTSLSRRWSEPWVWLWLHRYNSGG